jgi:hypothetical protein
MGGAAASQADAVVEATPEPDRAELTLDGVTRLGAAIRNSASAYNKGQVSDEAAKKLINEAIAIEDAEVKLKRSYVPKAGEKCSPASRWRATSRSRTRSARLSGTTSPRRFRSRSRFDLDQATLSWIY